MTSFLVRADYQLVSEEDGVFLRIDQSEMSWVDTYDQSSTFSSGTEARSAVLHTANALLQDAQTRLKASKGKKISKKALFNELPNWLCHFIDDKHQLMVQDLFKHLYIQELPITDFPLLRTYFFVYTNGRWVGACDNLISPGFWIVQEFQEAYSFVTQEGAIEAAKTLDLNDYTVFQMQSRLRALTSFGSHEDTQVRQIREQLHAQQDFRTLQQTLAHSPEPTESTAKRL